VARLLLQFLLALVASLLLTPLCRAISQRTGYVAAPSADRWHSRPTALFGGVAISLTVLVLGSAIRPITDVWPLLATGGLIAAFGLLDDVLHLKASTKLIAQILIASVLLFLGYRLHATISMVGDAMLTLFWIVGITNAFNLLDNMDGLCAGVATIAGLFVLATLAAGGSAFTPVATYVVTLLGATMGFLVFNLHPASIFMGDTGSLFLGVNFAALTVAARAETAGRSGLLSVMAVPVLLLMIPIFDTTLVTALRVLSGRAPSVGGRDHASHRLVAVGLSERMAVLVLWTLGGGGGVIAMLLRRPDPSWGLITALGFALALVIFAVYLARIRVYDDADLSDVGSDSLTPLVTNFMYKRRVAEVLLDCCLIPLAYYTSYRLRFEGDLLGLNYRYFIQSMPLVLAAQLIALFIVGGYRGAWRHFGMMDAVVFAKGVMLGTTGAVLAILYIYRFEHYSRSVFVIYAALLLLLLSGSRASFRLFGEFVERRREIGHRCVIYGTSGAALSTIRAAFGGSPALRILGFVDDDPRQHNMRVQGYPVVGDFRALVSMLDAGELDCIVINSPAVDDERLRTLEEACRQRQVSLLKLQIHLKPLTPATS
jgi:UDP-GlcNAc:undecaprenyl-phosphate/decaprenyl-phosphate GlcNAc-1-phosphate transferase